MNILAKLKKFDAAIIKIEIAILVVLLLEMTFLSFTQILMRNIFHYSFVWADVVVRWSVLWAAIVGASIAVTEKGHIHIDIMSHIIPEPYDEYIDAVLNLIAFGACLAFAWIGLNFVKIEMLTDKMVDPLPIHEWVFCLIFPIGFGIIAFKFLLLFFMELEDLQEKKTTKAETKAEA